MRKTYSVILILLLLWPALNGCRKRFDYRPAAGEFETGTDTLFLDSVFTGLSSPTYYFKIYNRSNHHIYIPEIRLERGAASFFRLNIDGVPGKQFRRVEIPAHDSIYVFAELTADISQMTDPVYEEYLLLRDNRVTKKVLLAAFVKDAYFMYPRRYGRHRVDSITIGRDADGNPVRVAGFLIPHDTTLTTGKAIVIYGHLGVPEGVTLRITEGAHLYFHYNSGIVVYEGGRIDIRGTRERPVILEDDRMQPAYDRAPGMWNFIWMQEGSKGNLIDYAIIRNAVAGLIVYPPADEDHTALRLTNTQIYDCSAYGIFAAATNIYGHNLVVNNTGSSALRVALGGRYDFRHCTFANYQPLRGLQDAAVFVSNYYDAYDDNGQPVRYVHPLRGFDLTNSIVYGNQAVEFLVDADTSAPCRFRAAHSLLKFSDPQHRINARCMDWDDPQRFDAVRLNQAPGFASPTDNDLHISAQGAATGLGDPGIAASVPYDLDGNPRLPHPDAGAYQHSEEKTFSNR